MLLRLAYLGVTNAFAMLRLLPMTDRDKDAEILALRHQITVLERQLGKDKIRFRPSDRAFLAALLHRPAGSDRTSRLMTTYTVRSTRTPARRSAKAPPSGPRPRPRGEGSRVRSYLIAVVKPRHHQGHRREARHHRTATGLLIGTPAYMGPERFSGTFDHAPAVYSLGCTAATGGIDTLLDAGAPSAPAAYPREQHPPAVPAMLIFFRSCFFGTRLPIHGGISVAISRPRAANAMNRQGFSVRRAGSLRMPASTTVRWVRPGRRSSGHARGH
ncbi:hypothetical protein SBI_09765 [Streptomyces bingchenggensis BCW-1]|uniref:Uncharacterized protein n=1 Tax=Streptomyces bingchenggensis (strain BCW-1) TaxID=749414 RepID=D7CBK6_STRBB|nr:hypothetical protein SBI_09765 [Streptomyces bingchenggensis BCW-1]